MDDKTHFEKTRLETARLLILPRFDAGWPLEAGEKISLRIPNDFHFNYALDDVRREQDCLRLLRACKFFDFTDSWSERSASRTQKPVPASLARQRILRLVGPQDGGCPRSFDYVRSSFVAPLLRTSAHFAQPVPASLARSCPRSFDYVRAAHCAQDDRRGER